MLFLQHLAILRRWMINSCMVTATNASSSRHLLRDRGERIWRERRALVRRVHVAPTTRWIVNRGHAWTPRAIRGFLAAGTLVLAQLLAKSLKTVAACCWRQGVCRATAHLSMVSRIMKNRRDPFWRLWLLVASRKSRPSGMLEFQRVLQDDGAEACDLVFLLEPRARVDHHPLAQEEAFLVAHLQHRLPFVSRSVHSRRHRESARTSGGPALVMMPGFLRAGSGRQPRRGCAWLLRRHWPPRCRAWTWHRPFGEPCRLYRERLFASRLWEARACRHLRRQPICRRSDWWQPILPWRRRRQQTACVVITACFRAIETLWLRRKRHASCRAREAGTSPRLPWRRGRQQAACVVSAARFRATETLWLRSRRHANRAREATTRCGHITLRCSGRWRRSRQQTACAVSTT